MYWDSVHSLEVCFECTRPLSWMYWGECTEIQYIRWRCVLNVPDHLVECTEANVPRFSTFAGDVFECTRPLSWMYRGQCTEIQYIRWRCVLNVRDHLVECTEANANVPRFSTFAGGVFCTEFTDIYSECTREQGYLFCGFGRMYWNSVHSH